MILRRFMKHVTDQDWFAVGLDVVVVIVGIFLGLLVQAWYEQFENAEDEREILLSLNTELNDILLLKQSDFDHGQESVDYLYQATIALYNKDQTGALNLQMF